MYAVKTIGSSILALGLLGGATTSQAGDQDLWDNFFGGDIPKAERGGTSCGYSQAAWKDNIPFEVDVGGWVSAGFTDGHTGMFNNNPHSVKIHQAWVCAERKADGSDGLDIGFRGDFMYGQDGADTQAFGNNPQRWDFINGWDFADLYSMALPQLYLEVAYDDFTLTAGRFFHPGGYERVTAPDNFFFSHTLAMFNAQPFTHWGAILEYEAMEGLTLLGGWTGGWDTAFDHFRNSSNAIFGATYQVTPSITFNYVGTLGNMGVRGKGHSHLAFVDAQLTGDLNAVVQVSYVDLNQSFSGFGPIIKLQNDEIGISGHLYYQVHEMVELGLRLEAWDSDAGFNYGGQALPNIGSNRYYNATFGVNIRPTDWFTIRPEVRYDHFPREFPGFGSYRNFIFAADAVLQF